MEREFGLNRDHKVEGTKKPAAQSGEDLQCGALIVRAECGSVDLPTPGSVRSVSFDSNLPKVNSTYGAPMGRHSGPSVEPSGPVTLARVTLDKGGYDEGGAYWGTPDNLFSASDGEGFQEYFRAANRMDAQRVLRERFPGMELAREYDGHAFVESYLGAALWSSGDDDEFEGLSVCDFAPEARARAEKECAAFIEAGLTDLVEMDEARAGFCFWLNRNGHGSGFWDESTISKEIGQRLSDLSNQQGGCDVYVGDDKKVYFG